MSIPVRLWRILRGRMIQVRERTDRALSEAERELTRARERTDAARAQADAARELEDGTLARQASPVPGPVSGDPPPVTEGRRASAPAAPSPGTAPRSERRDPFAEEWALLQVAPGSDLAALEAAYRARLVETAPERFPQGSPERAGAERRAAALTAAYERLRDTLNTTETRFEKLEF
jgi:hypothetical protein